MNDLVVHRAMRWYLIHTKPRSETLAQMHLERQGFEIYFPRLKGFVRRAGQRIDHVSALFPRYFFLHLHEGCQALGPVHSTVGVATIVRFGVQYAVVPDEVVEGLRLQADPASGLHRLAFAPHLAQGAKVRITAGPLGGIEGVFQRSAGTERVIVLLDLLGKESAVRVPSECIQRSFAA